LRLTPTDRRTYQQCLLDVLTSDDHVAALYRATAQRGEARLDTEMLLLCQLVQDKVASVSALPRDRTEFDAFWA
jgi:hypothetical protein